ncbi:MAG TPA: acyltransferase [Caulobacteraceae bacterium]|nr:acyltransferase [Caulobacteraceae bacterium]
MPRDAALDAGRPSAAARLDYEPGWDGLRAVAVASVVLFHAHAPMAGGGVLGVDIFFVLSGFLISTILRDQVERRGAVDVRGFFERRVRRLAPALYVMLVVTFVASRLFGPWPETPKPFAVFLAGAYLTDFYLMSRQAAGSFLNPTWSLAVEAQFYLLWPLVVTALARLPKRGAFYVLLLAWAAMTTLRGAVSHSDNLVAAYAPWLHATGLLLGSALAFLRPARTELFGWLGLIFAAVAMAPVDIGGAALPLAECGAALIIAAPPAILRLPPLVRLGEISYGVYLWHMPVIAALGYPVGLGAATLDLGVSILVAALSWRFVERRFLRRDGLRSTQPKVQGQPARP